MKEITFVITENTESVNTLKVMGMFVDQLKDDLYNWKWIIIAAHNCIQNYMVSALRSGTNLNVLEENSASNWFKEFTNRMKAKIEDWTSPKEKLEYFMNLYRKIKSDKMLFLTVSKKLEEDESKNEAMEWLNWNRNTFIHFIPSVFEINVVSFPKRMILIMEILKFLVSESNNILWINSEDKTVSEQLINDLIKKFKTLDTEYNSDKK
ncbi:MAG: hypothetical protein IPJ03_15150 [Ignavibacteriales bacterium]|nr:hypothetical protein [Ignavibacteriales bacterium]